VLPVGNWYRYNRNDKSGIAEVNQKEYIKVTKENLEKEHICRAISNNKDIKRQLFDTSPVIFGWLSGRQPDITIFIEITK